MTDKQQGTSWYIIGRYDQYEEADRARNKCVKSSRNYDFKVRAQGNGTFTLRRRLKPSIAKSS